MTTTTNAALLRHRREVAVAPALSLAPLTEIIGILRAASKDPRNEEFVTREFLRHLFARDRTMEAPHHLLVAYVPSSRYKRSGRRRSKRPPDPAAGRRAVGFLRRSLHEDDEGGLAIYVDHVWVHPAFRHLDQVGRRLLAAGIRFGEPQLDATLTPLATHGEPNTAETDLYTAMGFEWVDDIDMLMKADAIERLVAPPRAMRHQQRHEDEEAPRATS